jgi:hypothetical protein
VVHGRHLLLSQVEVPLPRLLVKAKRVMEEAKAGFRREWEKLEVECLQLSDWEPQLGNRIQVVSSRATEKQAKFEQEHEDLNEKMRRIFDREVSVISRERAVARKEKEVELKERTDRHTINTAKAMAKTIDDEQAALNYREQNLSLREVAVKEEEARLSALRLDLEAQTRALEGQHLRQEEESRSLSQRRQAPSSISSILPTLESVAEHLQRLQSTLVARLESEGCELAQIVVDHVLTCFQSHDCQTRGHGAVYIKESVLG